MIALRHMLHCSHLVQNGRGGEPPAVAAIIVEVMVVAGGGDSGSGSGGADLPSPAKVARLPPPAPPVPEAATSGDDDTLPAAKVARIVQTAPPPFPVLGQPACTKCSRNDDQHLCSCAFRSGAGRRITAAVCRHHWMQRPWWVDLWGPAACRVCGHS